MAYPIQKYWTPCKELDTLHMAEYFCQKAGLGIFVLHLLFLQIPEDSREMSVDWNHDDHDRDTCEHTTSEGLV